MKNEKPERIRRYRTRGWRLPVGAKCVTRPGPFGNPFKVTPFFTRLVAYGPVTAATHNPVCVKCLRLNQYVVPLVNPRGMP